MNNTSRLAKLQAKWGLSSAWQVLIILLVFALTGSTVLFIKQPLFALLRIEAAEPAWLQTVLYLLLVFPLYQIILLFYGFIFGQFRFFWEKEKKLGRAIAKLFKRRRTS